MALIETKTPTQRAKGKSATADLFALFPATPQLPTGHQGQYTNQEVISLVKTVVNGVITQNPDFPNQSMDYENAPNLTDASAKAPADGSNIQLFAPALGSPGPGSFDAKAIPVGFPSPGHSERNGKTTSPHTTSQLIAQQHVTAIAQTGIPGNLQQGRSFALRPPEN